MTYIHMKVQEAMETARLLETSNNLSCLDRGMQQGDQTVLSLRPGGSQGNILFGSSSSSSSLSFGSLSSSDLPLLRPHGGAPASSFPLKGGDSRFDGRERVKYTREQLLELKETTQLSDEILKLKRETDTELFGDEETWARGESVISNLGGDSRFDGRERVKYTREQLLELKETAQLSDEILKVKRETDTELFGEEETWARGESVISNLIGRNNKDEMMRDEVGIPKYVWWDMASCEVPDGCDPGEIRSILESALVKSYGPGPLTIFAIGDSSRVPRHVLEAMSRSGIIIKLTGIGVLSMVTDFIWWVTKHTPPAILMVISDLESAYENLLVKFEAKGYTIARAYLNRPPKSLKYTCNEWFWESLLTQETTRQELQGKCNETAWHCNLCFRDGQGFEDFTRHLDSEEHAFKDLLLLPHTPSVSPHEDLEDQDPFRKWMKTVSERILKQLKELEEEQEERIARLETKRREKHVNALADPVTPESHLESCEQWKSRSASQAADIEACRNLLKYALRFYSLGRGLCDECCVVL